MANWAELGDQDNQSFYFEREGIGHLQGQIAPKSHIILRVGGWAAGATLPSAQTISKVGDRAFGFSCSLVLVCERAEEIYYSMLYIKAKYIRRVAR